MPLYLSEEKGGVSLYLHAPRLSVSCSLGALLMSLASGRPSEVDKEALLAVTPAHGAGPLCPHPAAWIADGYVATGPVHHAGLRIQTYDALVTNKLLRLCCCSTRRRILAARCAHAFSLPDTRDSLVLRVSSRLARSIGVLDERLVT